MPGKNKSFFDSLWLNAIMSGVAIVGLIKNVIDGRYILVIVWVIISFHFIRAAKKAAKEKR